MTTDNCDTSLYRRTVECEEEGELADAAELYALTAFKDLLKDDFRPLCPMRIAFGHTLQAISADIRAGNETRPERLFVTTEPLYEALFESTDDPALEGLLNEWFGDAWFMLGRSRVTDYYQRAKEAYDSHPDPGRNWAFEEEFDYAYWAFEAFLNASERRLRVKNGNSTNEYSSNSLSPRTRWTEI